ncbi:sigma 54 modulation protein [Nitrosospira multiformis]|uniref:Ribosome hibernation promoting factor n=1 Tax=Nitrosospira multiformis TaxID=1231 RepID=A0A1I0G1G5_9PROT|nr:ribosome-associated translation inhibitor RaiA [Nitrosospira multiformis]SET64671.1 sigma 54 modulation protein [Nitrosospira multiformis]
MNIHVTGRQVEITSPLRDYVVSKLSRITQRFDQIVDITVTLSVEKLEQKAEALVRVPGNDIFVEADSTDMYASIDNLVDKLDRQLVRRKEKNESQRTDAV